MNRRGEGTRIERRMLWYLRLRLYRIITANYYSPHGEIDIIASKGNTLVFLEVRSKTEKSLKTYGTPGESVDARKQKNIIATARHFINNSYADYKYYRFDVLEVIKHEGGRLTINHIKNAFICDMNNSH